jgi:chloramphenicol-sensitive protein RarD
MGSTPASGSSRLALGAGFGCYFIWGLVPLVFQAIGRLGVSPWELLAHRTVWATPTALAFVLMAGQGPQALKVLRTPRTLAWLVFSSLLIAANWSVYIWSVNSGHVLETSLGYYLTPLVSLAAGALMFHERIGKVGVAAVGLALLGVALQALALGRIPAISLALALSFGGYGIVRKRIAAEAQTGLFIECLLLAVPGFLYAAWLERSGAGHFLHSPAAAAWLVACGPVTAVPLMLFSWAARRIPLSAMGFLQFVSPTISFFIGAAEGEALTPLRLVSFGFIWAGAAVFVWGAWTRARRFARIETEAELERAA